MVSSFLNFYILYLNIDAKRVVVPSFRDSSSRCHSDFLPIKVVWVMGSLITGSLERIFQFVRYGMECNKFFYFAKFELALFFSHNDP